ncbi:hypothetical protein [Terribacillus saccharophilus]|uniref:hypothetical protein n=1 Tax=Terribacillus saccharophilus TaxID=361277 RepID=UPI002DC3E5A6|nr:hypothetical protein [Terribacillus saccharophilus]MEC0291853.1 hypothetical protein [Terribacillus saccharophilus]
MRKSYIYLWLIMIIILAGCSEKDVYDVMRESRQEEYKRIQRMSTEEREAEELAKKEDQEKEKSEQKAEQIQRDEKESWEENNTDKIYYQINRYSEDGKFIVEGKYTLTPISKSDLKIHKFENRGFNSDLDNDNILVVDRNFFEYTPSGKFDIYVVLWEKGSRQKAVSVDLAYRNVSRGW